MARIEKRSQRERFIEAAREAGADEDPEAFKERLKRLVKADRKPKEPQKAKKNAKR